MKLKEKVTMSVSERIAIANEKLSQKNGVDPNNPRYKSDKKKLNEWWEALHARERKKGIERRVEDAVPRTMAVLERLLAEEEKEKAV